MLQPRRAVVALILLAAATLAIAAEGWLGLRSDVEATGGLFDRRIEKVTVASTGPGSPAEAAGVRAGDVIVAINGKALQGMKTGELAQHLQTQAGDKLTLTVRRGGEGAEALQIVVTAAAKK
ncbi:S41 family peptidase [Roseateles cellulosilyticus]|uniref:PDZ domain-containing protein n=1 Tax=Pelomonas cellulosilytica TaxID=2906762 RepID=A0ABS8XPQ6_9BURK|nr:PDZ domain-containing protein [Pelomonas sp. P8]MCE4554734.1 PDZ domain-containing protein [Pelomonas sp. P8]